MLQGSRPRAQGGTRARQPLFGGHCPCSSAGVAVRAWCVLRSIKRPWWRRACPTRSAAAAGKRQLGAHIYKRASTMLYYSNGIYRGSVYTTSRLGSGRSRSAMSAVVSSLSVRDMGCSGGLSLALALDSRDEKNRCMEMNTMVTPVCRPPCEIKRRC
jgi:hypothetical protein